MESTDKILTAVIIIPDGFFTNESCIAKFNKKVNSEKEVKNENDVDSDYDLNNKSEDDSSTDIENGIDSEHNLSEKEIICSYFPDDAKSINCLNGLHALPLCCMTLPALNQSLLSLNLRCLRKAGVTSFYIIVNSNYCETVQNHLKCIRKKINSYSVISVNATSFLEALREARQKQLNCLQDDFFLMLGDIFLTQGIQHLKNLYLNHYKTVKQDSSRLMTRLVGELPSLPPCDSSPVSHKAIIRAFTYNHPFADYVLLVNPDSDKLMCMSTREGNQSLCVFVTSSMLDKNPDNSLRLLPSTISSGVDFVSIHFFDLVEDQFDIVDSFADLVQCILTDELQQFSVGIMWVPPCKQNLHPQGFRVTNSTLLHLLLISLDMTNAVNTFVKNLPSVEPTCQVLHSFVGKNVQIRSGTVVEHCIVFDNVDLGSNGFYRYCTIFPNVSTPANAKLNHCVIQSEVSQKVFDSLEYSHALITKEKIFEIANFGDFLDETMQTNDLPLEYITASYFLNNHEESETEDIGSKKFSLEDGELEASTSENDSNNDGGTPEDSSFFEISCLLSEALHEPDVLEHKILEIKALRLACCQGHNICIKPCLKAILSFLLQTYSNLEAVTLDDLESHRLDEIFDFLIEESELNQKKILQSLYDIVNSKEELDSFQNTTDVKESKSIQQITPNGFAQFLVNLRQLDVLADPLLILWCQSIPCDSLYYKHLQSVANALLEHTKTSE